MKKTYFHHNAQNYKTFLSPPTADNHCKDLSNDTSTHDSCYEPNVPRMKTNYPAVYNINFTKTLDNASFCNACAASIKILHLTASFTDDDSNYCILPDEAYSLGQWDDLNDQLNGTNVLNNKVSNVPVTVYFPQ